ncbi:XVIPCD domain-containing protein [Pseudoxanthomonas sp.]|uniref:XVIPCD domain-containing protein n=1 Tax=Pseudoxanthomonas sp. TaxID=1871049 RepID=UPI0026385F8D|nr:XVIPCD domain-containing protein [Pseudoxanthomonas sp.]WDS34684.1 MAG: hypothetical protein O8I58_09760 [Pseudoxanthomonas sp.]
MTPDTPAASPSGSTPPDDPLYRQCEAGVRQLEAQLGRPFDASSERLSAGLAVLAHEHGLSRVDHVLLSEDGPHVGRGEHVFVVQGALGDPAQLRAHMRTEEAVALTVQQSFARLQQLQEAHRLAVSPAQDQPPLQRDPTQQR